MKMHFKVLCFLMLMSCIFVLQDCDKNKKSSSIEQYIQEIKNKYTIHRTVSLRVKEPVKAIYHFSHLRNPFQNPYAQKPRKNYPNAVLKTYPLDSLRLVGTLGNKNNMWAIITTPEGKTYKVSVDMRIGTNQALVTKILKNSVQLLDQGDVKPGQKGKIVTIEIKKSESR